MAKRTRINDISLVSPEQITHANLTVLHETGQSVYVSGTGKNKEFRYRVGKQTEIGDIEISIWKQLVEQLVANEGDEELLDHYREWIRKNCPWIRTEKAAEEGAYLLYVSQTCLNRNWWGYVRFNMDYYPERLSNDQTLISVQPDCCKQVFRAPIEAIRSNHLDQQVIHCPFCNERSTFTRQ